MGQFITRNFCNWVFCGWRFLYVGFCAAVAPIDWFSKKQRTVEASTFESEFVAMRPAMKHCKSL